MAAMTVVAEAADMPIEWPGGGKFELRVNLLTGQLFLFCLSMPHLLPALVPP
jgi:hypothetical protein